MVRGYVIDFSVTPPPRLSCPLYHMDREQEKALDQEIAEMVAKKAIEEVNPQKIHFISPMFVVPKKGGRWRPVLNLKSLNQYVRKTHFKMEDIRNLKDILQENDFMAKLDLREAYFSIPMAEESRKFLQFKWKRKCFQFTCLPFGLSSAPYIFTKLLKPVLTCLREQGIRCLMYIDDMLILGKTQEELTHNFQICKSLLISLGFMVNEEKSVAGPLQELEFLGFLISSKSMTLTVTTEKLKSLILQCKQLLQTQWTTI